MLILTQDKWNIVNLDSTYTLEIYSYNNVQEYYIKARSITDKFCTLGGYKNLEIAQDVLKNIYIAFSKNKIIFEMPMQ